jgi:copper chaperone
METIKIKGLSCQHCVMAVTKALDEIEGIENVTVDLERGEASFDKTITVDRETIRKGISDAGYEVE